MFTHRATYLLTAELAFIGGIAIGEFLPASTAIMEWLLASMVLIAFHYRDARVVFWAGVFTIALFGGESWHTYLGNRPLWQLPHARVFDYLAMGRERFVEFFQSSLPAPYGNLVASSVVGGKGLLSKQLKDAFIVTGTIHITAVSGYNVAVVMKLFSEWLNIFSRKISFVIGTMVVFAFAATVGGQASVVRAAILGWLFLVGKLVGRPASTLPMLVFTAMLMVVHKPSILFHDIGFQLSFAAFIGIVYISPLLKTVALTHKQLLPPAIVNILADTVGAQLAVMPIILFHFGQLAPFAPIVNFLVLPIVPLLTIAAVGIGSLGVIGGSLITPGAYLLYPFVWYLVAVVEWFAQLPGSHIRLAAFPWWMVALSYVAIYLIVSHVWKRQKIKITT
ncbi:ComEC/Rec2 family competence protein [Candidatus Berkelbacteria bacterium]|nr:ComEC/Rec2 family competence protein [Candidatus Berkelbacteria bacterium]